MAGMEGISGLDRVLRLRVLPGINDPEPLPREGTLRLSGSSATFEFEPGHVFMHTNREMAERWLARLQKENRDPVIREPPVSARYHLARGEATPSLRREPAGVG